MSYKIIVCIVIYRVNNLTLRTACPSTAHSKTCNRPWPTAKQTNCRTRGYSTAKHYCASSTAAAKLILQIPITNPNATHFGINIAVDALWNLQQNLRYLLHLHRARTT